MKTRARKNHPPSPRVPIDYETRQSRRILILPFLFTLLFLGLGFLSRARASSHLAWTYIGIAAFLLLWQSALFVKSGRHGPGFKWTFVAVRSHYIQAAVQIPIYIYWGLYWPRVYPQIPLILSQLAFLYAFDALLSWSRGQTWRLGFGPLPIIFSSNLFIWFKDDIFIFQFLLIVTGVLGKQFIRWRREGKLTHIFNPSAFALTLFSLVLIATNNTGLTWGEEIAFTLARPPHMFIEIFLCGLVVQYFFSVTLLTFSAAVVISIMTLAYTHFTGVYMFFYTNIPVAIFLGFHLLMTDPATTPRSSLGKIIFGSLYGASAFIVFIFLKAYGIPEFYDKLLVVPLLNLLTPFLDRLASADWSKSIRQWELAINPRKANLAFMSCWILVFAAMLTSGFVEGPHPGATIDFWIKAAQNKRPDSQARLQFLLDEFTRVKLDDPSQVWNTRGMSGELNRTQALGLLCNQVAWLYADGKLVPADPAKALLNFSRACEFGNSEACANIAIQYLLVNRAEAQSHADLALATLEKEIAESTNGYTCFLVGYACENGRGHHEDKVAARKYYQRGASLGDLESCKHLISMLLAGEGGPVDHAAAAHWLQVAADAHDGASCLLLAKLYYTGDGVARDVEREAGLLKQACDLGVSTACELLRQNQR